MNGIVLIDHKGGTHLICGFNVVDAQGKPGYDLQIQLMNGNLKNIGYSTPGCEVLDIVTDFVASEVKRGKQIIDLRDKFKPDERAVVNYGCTIFSLSDSIQSKPGGSGAFLEKWGRR